MVIPNTLKGKALHIYGDGQQLCDWPHVGGGCHARVCFTWEVTLGEIGVAYNIIGAHNEKTKMEVVQTHCDLLDEFPPNHPYGIKIYRELIAFVSNRPGHDNRYATYASKIDSELGCVPEETFEPGRRQTVEGYRDNINWCQHVFYGSCQRESQGLGVAS